MTHLIKCGLEVHNDSPKTHAGNRTSIAPNWHVRVRRGVLQQYQFLTYFWTRGGRGGSFDLVLSLMQSGFNVDLEGHEHNQNHYVDMIMSSL